MRRYFTSLFNKGKSDISSLCRSVPLLVVHAQDSTFAAGEPIRNSCVIASTAEWQPAITGKTDAVDFAGF